MSSLTGYVDSREVHLFKVRQQQGLEKTMRARRKVQRGTKVNHACLYCRSSYMTCDEGRPCRRWWVLLLWIESSCLFTAHFIVWLPSFFLFDLDGYNCSFIPQSRLGILNPTYKIFVGDCIYSEDMLDKVRLAYTNGLQIGPYTWSHPHLPSLTREQGE